MAEPLTWGGVDGRFSPEVFEVEAPAVLDACPAFRLVGTDCSEPPCVAVVTTGDPTAHLARCEAWAQAYGRALTNLSVQVDCGDTQVSASLVTSHDAVIATADDMRAVVSSRLVERAQHWPHKALCADAAAPP